METLAYSAELGSIQTNPIQSLSHTHTVSGKSMAISAIIKCANAQHRPPFAACRIRVQRRRSEATKKKEKKKKNYPLISSAAQ